MRNPCGARGEVHIVDFLVYLVEMGRQVYRVLAQVTWYVCSWLENRQLEQASKAMEAEAATEGPNTKPAKIVKLGAFAR